MHNVYLVHDRRDTMTIYTNIMIILYNTKYIENRFGNVYKKKVIESAKREECSTGNIFWFYIYKVLNNVFNFVMMYEGDR